MPEMHHDGRHLEFQNGDLFSCKTSETGYHFAINFFYKASGSVYFNNKKCYYLGSYVDGHIIQDGCHLMRWPPFLYIKPSLH